MGAVDVLMRYKRPSWCNIDVVDDMLEWMDDPAFAASAPECLKTVVSMRNEIASLVTLLRFPSAVCGLEGQELKALSVWARCKAPRRGARCEECATCARLRDNMVCAGCGTHKTQGFKICAGCRLVRYCGDACRMAHWGEHKDVCNKVQSMNDT